MKTKTILITVAVIAVAGFVILATVNRQPAPPAKVEKPKQTRPAPAVVVDVPPAENTPPVESEIKVKAEPVPEPVHVQPVQSLAAKDPPPQDPMARAALSFVGADPDAEIYWMGAINDPSLPAEERQNLIEDLNEDGLSDPKHPTLDDLPLIWNRLLLIEQLAPYAMDQVNADAFLEAYKDLINLANLSVGAGEPVK
jgi:hypothetical protein